MNEKIERPIENRKKLDVIELYDFQRRCKIVQNCTANLNFTKDSLSIKAY